MDCTYYVKRQMGDAKVYGVVPFSKNWNPKDHVWAQIAIIKGLYFTNTVTELLAKTPD
jgi:hypothetical protein